MKNNAIQSAKDRISIEVFKRYPALVCRMEEDPEDPTVLQVTLYGVADDQLASVRESVWTVIESVGDVDGVDFVPSVVRLSDTMAYYPNFMPKDLNEVLVGLTSWGLEQEWNKTKTTGYRLSRIGCDAVDLTRFTCQVKTNPDLCQGDVNGTKESIAAWLRPA